MSKNKIQSNMALSSLVVVGVKLIKNLGDLMIRSKLSEAKFVSLLVFLILYDLYLYDFSLAEYSTNSLFEFYLNAK